MDEPQCTRRAANKVCEKSLTVTNPTKVSVVMPVFNGERYLRDAIDSILFQTFRDFELLLINDGSTDLSASIIAAYKDRRIRVFKNDETQGLATVRNRGIDEARGEYIAWLDCDDVSAPTRLERQVTLLDSNESVSACGTWVRTIGDAPGDEWRYPTDSNFLRCRMIFDDPLATSSVMLRKEVLSAGALRFDSNYPPAEDYELWERLSHNWDITNVPEVLTYYRVHKKQTSAGQIEKQRSSVWRIQQRQINALNILPTEEEKLLHLKIGVQWQFDGNKEFVDASRQWLHKLAQQNHRVKAYPEPAFSEVLAERWLYVCSAAAERGLSAWPILWKPPRSKYVDLTVRRRLRLLVQCVINQIVQGYEAIRSVKHPNA